jgi:hypothetical protein
MALTTVDYSSFFDYSETTKQIKFTDKTDFVAQGTTATNVTVVAKVEGPSGVFYNNTNHSSPDIDPDVSLDSVITIPLPLDGSGLPEQGLYTITLTYQDLVVGPTTVVEARTFTLNYGSPVVDIQMTVDCITPLLKAEDDTNYTINTVDPTITRDFKIHYPPSTPTADVTGTSSTISTQTFYTVADSTIEHSSSLTSTLSYLFDVPNSMYVLDEVTGSKVIQVACNGDICDIYCCIRSQWNRYQSAKSSNSALAAKELAIFKEITSLSQLVGNAVLCGKNDHISGYVSEILKLANCDAGCSCDDGTPQLVTGLAVNGNNVVVDAGTGVVVNAVTGGGTTTYTVSLTTENINKLAATYNSVVAAGTNVTSVTSSSATVGDVTTTTYTVNATDTVVESLFVRSVLTFAAGVVPVPTINSQKEYGSSFGTVNQSGGTEFLLNNNNASSSDWLTNYANFTVGNFFSGGDVTYFPEVRIVNITKSTDQIGGAVSWTNDVTADIISMGSNSFQLRFLDASGTPVNGQKLQEFETIELIFKIHA